MSNLLLLAVGCKPHNYTEPVLSGILNPLVEWSGPYSALHHSLNVRDWRDCSQRKIRWIYFTNIIPTLGYPTRLFSGTDDSFFNTAISGAVCKLSIILSDGWSSQFPIWNTCKSDVSTTEINYVDYNSNIAWQRIRKAKCKRRKIGWSMSGYHLQDVNIERLIYRCKTRMTQ